MLKFRKFFSTKDSYTILNLTNHKYIMSIYTRYNRLKQIDVKCFDYYQEKQMNNNISNKHESIQSIYDKAIYSTLLVNRMKWDPVLIKNLTNILMPKPEIKLYFKFGENKIECITNEIEKIFGVTFIILKHNISVDKLTHPLNKEQLPVIIDKSIDHDIELGIPGHNLRHYKLAKKYGFKIKQVIVEELSEAFNKSKLNLPLVVDDGYLINSNEFDFLSVSEARDLITKYIEKNRYGVRLVNDYGMIKIDMFSFGLLNRMIGINNKFYVDLLIITPDDNNNLKILDFLFAHRYYLQINNSDIENLIKEADDIQETIGNPNPYLPVPFKNIIFDNFENIENSISHYNEINIEKLATNDNSDIITELHIVNSIQKSSLKILNHYLNIIKSYENYNLGEVIKQLNNTLHLLSDFKTYSNTYYFLFTNYLVLLYSIYPESNDIYIKNISLIDKSVPFELTQISLNRLIDTINLLISHLKLKRLYTTNQGHNLFITNDLTDKEIEEEIKFNLNKLKINKQYTLDETNRIINLI